MRSLNEFKEEINGIFERSKPHDNVKNLTFIRWGNLNPVKQKGYVASPDGDNHSFHAPPARKGMYAFPWPYIEHFLLGSTDFIPDRDEWVKRPDGSLIEQDDKDAEEWEKRVTGSQYKKLPTGGKKKGFISKERKIEMDFQAGRIDKETYEKQMDAAEKEREERYDKGYFLAKQKPPKKFKHTGEIWHHLKTGIDVANILDEHGDWVLTDMETYKKALSKEAGENQKHKEREGYGISRDHYEVFIEKIKSPVKRNKPIPPIDTGLEDEEEEVLEEKWERPLALGYSNEAEGAEEAEDILNNDEEEIPGETEFPTLKRLKMIKDKMSQHDLNFTVPYDEFRRRPSGEK